LGALSGGTLSFLLGRNWAFFNKENGIFGQAGKYLMANFGSICLNTSGVYLLTEVISNNHYLVSKVLVAGMIGLCYNFPMQRYFVFRKTVETNK
jgi:putative flippase GtrA